MKLKKLLSIILAATMLLTTVQFSFAFLLSAENEIIYYVAKNGNDENDGLTEETALATINKAQELIAAGDTATTGQDGKIIVIGTATFDGGVAHKGMITIQGNDEYAALTYSTVSTKTSEGSTIDAVILSGPTTFDNILLEGTSIVSAGHKVVYNLAKKSGKTTKNFYVGHVDSTPDGTRENIVVNGLSTVYNADNNFYLGAISDTKTVSPGVDLEVNAGRLYRLQLLKDTTFSGNVNIVLNYFQNRGDYNLNFKDNGAVLNAAFQVIINNGRISQCSSGTLTRLAAVTAAEGAWVMRCDQDTTNGTMLDVTETNGKFAVSSDMVAKAYKVVNDVADELPTAISRNGILDLSAYPGVYNVKFSAAGEPIDTNKTVVVAEYGNDANEGTEDSPLATIDFAQKRLAQSSVEGEKKILVIGKVDFDGGEPHDEMITIEGYVATASLNLVASKYKPAYSSDEKDGVLLQGPTTFDTISFSSNETIVNNGHKIVYQNMPDDENFSTYTHVFGNTAGRQEIVINDTLGTIDTPHALWFAADYEGKKMAGVDLEVNGGTINQFCFSKTTFTGDVNFELNNFKSTSNNGTAFVNDGSIFEGAFTLIARNGTYANFTDEAKTNLAAIEATKGAWVMSFTEGGNISATSTPGTFAVSSGVKAIAVNRATNVTYTSEGGLLTVPAGVYEVTYEDSVDRAVYIDAVNASTETVGQKVHLENGKTYKFSFSYRNIENGLGNNVDVAVYSGKNILYSSALTGANNIKFVSEANDTYSRVYEFTFNGTTGDYEVGLVINGTTLMRFYNPRLVEGNSTVNLYKNSVVEKNLENWIVSSVPVAADANEHSNTQENAYVTIKTGNYYLSDYSKPSSNAKALHIKSDGQFSIGTNVELKGGTTYRLIIDHKDVQTDFSYDSYVVVRGAYGSNDINEPFRTTNDNASNSTLLRVEEDAEMSRAVYEFIAESDGIHGIGVRVHSTAGTNHLTEFFETNIGNIVLYDIGNPSVNLLKNSDFSDNLNGWYVAEHVEVADDKTHTITSTTDIKLEPTATSYGNPSADKDSIELVSMDKNFFKIPKGDEIGPEGMIHIQNDGTWREFYANFKGEDALKANHTYIFSYAYYSNNGDFVPKVTHTADRKRVFAQGSLSPISEEVVEGNGYTYKVRTYELTFPEVASSGAELSDDIYLGIDIGPSLSGWFFDIQLYDKADLRKTNLIPNGELRSGLDHFLWGWTAYFRASSLGFGWTSWPPADDTTNTSKLDVAPYDFVNFVSFEDDAYYTDGEWWNPNDVETLETQEIQSTFSATIVDDKGNPLKDITAELKSASNSGVAYTAKTDSKGFFEIKDVAADIYSLTIISADGSRREMPEYITVATSEIVTLNIKVAPAEIILSSTTTVKKSTIKGTLYNAKRETLSGVTVGVARDKTVVTDENGNFEFENLPAGNYKIFAVNPDGSYYLLRDYELAEGQEVTFKLKYDTEVDKVTNQNMSTDNSQDSDADNESGFPWWILIVIGSVLILGAGAVITIIILKKKKS